MNRLRLVIVLVVVLGLLAFVYFHEREPRYQGRSLSEWIGSVGSTQITDPDQQAASHALKQMAPEAIPFLLKWVEDENSPQMQKLIDWSEEHTSFHLMLNDARLDNEKAHRGFGLLGKEAKPAWPTFIQWTYSTNSGRRGLGFWCLAQASPDKDTLLPVLKRLIHDPDRGVQFSSASIFIKRYPEEAESNGVYKLLPSLKKNPTTSSVTNTPAPNK